VRKALQKPDLLSPISFLRNQNSGKDFGHSMARLVIAAAMDATTVPPV
jgi:hypothetical protein